MSSGFLFWSSVVLIGIILGALFRPRHIAIVLGCIVGIGILGLVLSGIAGSDVVWYFGIGLMAGLPATAIILLFATVVHSVTRQSKPNNDAVQGHDQVAGNIRGAIDEALTQFRADKSVTVACPNCRKDLSVSYDTLVNQLIVNCPCNSCRGEFPK